MQLGAFRFVFALIAGMLILSITSGLVESFGGGAAGWRNVAILYAGILVVINTISVLSVKELPEEDNAEEIQEKHSFFKSIGYCIHNRYYLIILGIYIANYMMSGISQGVGIYYMTYVLENPSLLGLFSMAGMLPMMIGIMFTPIFVKKYGMYRTNKVSMLLAAVLCVPFIIAAQMRSVLLMVVFSVLRGFFLGPLTGTLNALIAETAKYSYLKENVHIEGTMFSCSSMGMKLGGGIGSAVCGWLLAAGGFNGMAEVQTAGALNMISFMYVIVPLVFYIILWILATLLNVESVNKVLEEKNNQV